MPGMGRAPQAGDSVVVSAFRALLGHDALILLLFAAALLLIWNAVMASRVGRPSRVPAPSHIAEPPARLVLRIGFGLLWIVDGLLQLQPAMPLGLPAGVVQPAEAGSPSWIEHLVNVGVTIWTNHPVGAATATVWVQLGIGLLALLAPSGTASRAAGAVSAGWGLVVWVFGEAMGGLFGGGVSWLFGAPGAALLYVVAGVLLALPYRVWAREAFGRRSSQLAGVYFVGMALLQAWPGRGFWQGRDGSLTAMVHSMATTSQPHFLSSWLAAFGDFVSAHGFAVNLFVVLSLALIGAALVSGWRSLVADALAAATVLCLAAWILVQDLGFLGGVGTDPNSMVPTVLLVVACGVAYLYPAAVAPAPVPVEAPSVRETPAFSSANAAGSSTLAADGEPVQAPPSPATSVAGLRPGRAWHWLRSHTALQLAGMFGTVAAVVVIAFGAIPMALAATNPNADPVLAMSVDGTPDVVNTPAPTFQLLDQHGDQVSLGDLRGRTVALTFLDPVCVSDCPLIAQELRVADSLLPGHGKGVALVAVVANPLENALSYVRAFDQQESLDHLPNWWFLTGTDQALQQVWSAYGVPVAVTGAGAMVAHPDIVYLIDKAGRTREVLNSDPGSGPAASSSFSVYLSQQIAVVMGE